MAVLREALRLVKRQPDGSYQCNNRPLGKPGDGGLCVLGIIPVEVGTGADEIAILDGGDWLVKITGAKYTVVLGIEPDAAEVLLLGNSLSYGASPPVEPLPPLIHDDGLSGIVNPTTRSVTVDGVVMRRYNPDDKTTLVLTTGQARQMQKLLNEALGPA